MSSSPTPPPTTDTATKQSHSSQTPYSYATSRIVRVGVAAGVIVLVLSVLVLFFKISSWIRYRQRLRRQYHLTTLLQSEQRATAYEIAAWADEPGTAPNQKGWNESGGGAKSNKNNNNNKKSRKERLEEIKALKRGGANAYAVHEWEGVAA